MSALIFDIETIPDVAAGRRLHNLDDPAISDQDVVRALEQLQFQKNGSTFLPHYLHQVVAISLVFEEKDSIKITTLSGDEKTIVSQFFEGIERYTPTLVSWNGSGFDLPVLHYRALLHGVEASCYWDTGDHDKDFRFNNYLSRYHARHTDVMDILAGYSPRAFAPLDTLSKMLGLPGKQGLDGSKVWEAYQQGQLQSIYNYCEIDVLNTYLIYLRFEKIRGNLAQVAYAERLSQLRAFIEQSGAQHLNDYLKDLPADY